jgi:hypothetical protein
LKNQNDSFAEMPDFILKYPNEKDKNLNENSGNSPNDDSFTPDIVQDINGHFEENSQSSYSLNAHNLKLLCYPSMITDDEEYLMLIESRI